ncbi:unnamed protein product [Calypogeia fissa]
MEQQAPARLTKEEMKMSRFVCNAVYFLFLVFFSTMSGFVEGLPIRGPDLSSCKPVIPPKRTAADAVECCFVDTGRPIKDFKFNLDLPMRVRRPAHKLDDESVRKYERAVELMRALPPEDPRSLVAQSKLHCAYCAGAYNQFNSSEGLNVHMCFLDVPFHRWYLYFHERILASLLGDDTFAMPYWAWDVQNDEHNPQVNSIPSIYTNPNSSLYHEYRSKIHQPPHRADLQYFGYSAVNKNPHLLLQDNLYSMWMSMIGHVQTTEAFYGGKFSQGDGWSNSRTGEFEGGPHASIHWWTGDGDRGMSEDMGPAFSAARDPIFFAHHSNVDRLWTMWKSWGGQDFEDPDWLDAEFLFYDENSDLVRVNVRDSLHFDNFRVAYEQVEADWLNYKPKSMRELDPKYAQAGIWRGLWRQVLTLGFDEDIALSFRGLFQKEKNAMHASLGGVRRATVTSRVVRPDVRRKVEESAVYDEVLVISGVVEKPFDAEVVINMFLELPEADETTPQHCVEFLGGVKMFPEGLPAGMDPTVVRNFTKILGIKETLQILGITRKKSVTVTFVPAWDPKHDSAVLVGVTDLKAEIRRAR